MELLTGGFVLGVNVCVFGYLCSLLWRDDHA